MGAGNFGAVEIYGVIDDDFENSSIPDGVWYTLHLRATQGLPAHFLAIGEDGMGGVMCIDCREDGNGEGPVLVVRLGAPESVAQEKVASDFGTYLLEMVITELEEEG
ncbi:SMI1/KNR4 family protein [Alcanivorax sp. 24]|uniref:SMI1/KNR4 family protein n=1 Tax=Alcanivorax sp. 24 TaxID=2545266 RepID=UPI00105BE243|nr:SMI1/KNR4 family protein [Alcanivorax sp. 24]